MKNTKMFLVTLMTTLFSANYSHATIYSVGNDTTVFDLDHGKYHLSIENDSGSMIYDFLKVQAKPAGHESSASIKEVSGIFALTENQKTPRKTIVNIAVDPALGVIDCSKKTSSSDNLILVDIDGSSGEKLYRGMTVPEVSEDYEGNYHHKTAPGIECVLQRYRDQYDCTLVLDSLNGISCD